MQTTSLTGVSRWTWRLAVANLIGQIVIVFTGGIVRLTGSGLGCSTWPQCEPGAFTPAFHEASSIHPFVEFGNRTLTGVLVAIGVALAAFALQERSRALSLRVLGCVPLAGVLVQAVVGGLSVLTRLSPALVGSHMVLSLILVCASTWLVVRCREGDGPASPTVSPLAGRVGIALGVVAAIVLVLGVVTTGSGPHSGDDQVAQRFAFDPVVAARVHSLATWVLVALTAVLVWLVRRGAEEDPRPEPRRATLALAIVLVCQGAIGYAQYFTGLPPALVALHMLGAAALTAAVTWTVLSLRERPLPALDPIEGVPVPAHIEESS